MPPSTERKSANEKEMLTLKLNRSASYWCQVGQQTWKLSLDPLLVHCSLSSTKLLGAKPVLSACSCTPLHSTRDLRVCAKLFPKVPSCLSAICHDHHHDHQQSHDIRFCQVCQLITIRRGLVSHTDGSCRDGGLPASRFFAKVHSKHEMPLNALVLTTVLVVIFGCIFLGSSR